MARVGDTNITCRICHKPASVGLYEQVDANKVRTYNASDVCRDCTKAWKKKTCALNHNRRAKINGIEGSLDKYLFPKLVEKQGDKCALCGEDMKGNGSIDHIIPLSRGGLNIDENVQIVHWGCNSKKGNKLMVELDWAKK